MTDIDKTLDELHDSYQRGSGDWLNGELTLKVLKALAARVEALEKRQHRVEHECIESGAIDEPSTPTHREKFEAKAAASGGPKRGTR